MKVQVENVQYELIEDYKSAFSQDEFVEKCTDYFYDYDYVVGDIAYGKLRLKGFYDAKNKKATKINNFQNVKEYIKKYCANDCKYYILKKIK